MATHETLDLGSSGDYVRFVQQFLVDQLDSSMAIPPSVTGEYDEDTADAVRAFQGAHGLEPTGAVDPPTWDVINDIVAVTGVTGYGDRAETTDPADEVVMDFAPEAVGPGIRAVPTQEDAARGRQLLRELVFEDAHADAQVFAHALEEWGYDWEPNEEFLKMARTNVEGWLSGNPRKIVKGATSWLVGILMETEYAQYKGRTRAFASTFYRAAADGVQAGLLDGPFAESRDDFLTAGAAGAWERTTSLPAEDKQAIIAAAVAASDGGLPTDLDEYQRRVWDTGEVYDGVYRLLDGWDDIL